MGNLYLIRHAQSEANRERIMASRLPYPLTRAGKEDADLIASQLADRTTIQRIITSPLLRARQTAESFSQVFGVSCKEDERLTEQDLGKYSGMTYDQVKEEPLYENETLKRWSWVPQGGGESYEMIAGRVLSFFEDLDPMDRNNILIVTHAVTFRLIRAVLERTLPSYPAGFPNNGEIWKVDFHGTGHTHRIESLLLGNSRDFVHNP